MPAKRKAVQAEAAPKTAKKVAEKAAERHKKSEKNGGAGPQLSRVQMAQAVADQVNEKYKGDIVFIPTKELELVYLTRRVPTGILSIDVELGGGLPCAGITQLIGRRNCGKTDLYWRALGQLQLILGPKLSAMLAMNEMHADISQARLAGVIIAYSEKMIEEFDKAQFKANGTHLTKEQVDDMRKQVGNFHEVVAYSGEDLYQAVLDGIYENAYHFVAIDSIGNVMSSQEAENETLRDKTRGGASVANTQFVHKILPMLMTKAPNGTVRDPCVVVVNQIRDDQKNPDAPYKNTGGHALEHAKFVDIFLSPGQTIGEEKKIKVSSGEYRQRREIWGKEVNWQIVKGKAGIHEGARGSWCYYFNDERAPVWSRAAVDIYADTVLYAARYGGLVQSGAWYELPNPADEKNPLFKACGLEAAAQELYDDDIAHRQVNDPNTLMKKIRDRMFAIRGIKLNNEWRF